MPGIKVIYWNIEDFGEGLNGRRGNYVPLCNFIAQVVRNVDADVICLQELKAAGTGFPLAQLQQSLLNAYAAGGAATCDWYCDWVPGSLTYHAFGPPYDPNTVGFTGIGRNEGYAVLWKQNIDKFIMQRADPINLVDATPPGFLPPLPAVAANTQSGGTRARTAFGLNILPADINVPAVANPYTLPAGSVVSAAGIIRVAAPAVPAGPVAAPIALSAGDIIGIGTTIGAAGLQLNNPVMGVNPIVVPGGYTLSNALSLPAAGTTLTALHSLSLVLTGRIGVAAAANYNPLGANVWTLLSFPSTAGAMLWNGSRRPAFCTIKVNSPGLAGANQLIPLVMYHTPVANPGLAMQVCARSQVLYEAYNAGGPAPGYARNSLAVAGGDVNADLDPAAVHYTAFTANLGPAAGVGGGVGCNTAGVPNIRVHNPAPPAWPVFPPAPAPLPPPPPTVRQNPENKTSVHLRHPVIAGQPTLSAAVDHYRGKPIDNIFYRGFIPAQAPNHGFRATLPFGVQQQFTADVYDLLRAVSQLLPAGAAPAPGGAPADNFFIPPGIIAAFAGLPVFALLAMLAAPPLGLNASRHPATLLANVGAGIFQPIAAGDPPAGPGPYAGPAPLPANLTAARRAAEFIRLFVSDHLPVIFSMNL